MSIPITRRGAALLATAATLLLTGLLAASQAQASTIYACVKTKSGTARVFTKKPKCKKGETKISWNAQGAAGKNGTNGTNGTSGTNGTNGTNGVSALSTLPSGQSESGDYGASSINAAFFTEGVTFPIPLAADIPQSNISWTFTGKGPNCSGPGHASPGYLCIYSGEHTEIEPPLVYNFEGSGRQESGRFGFTLEWESPGPSFRSYDAGTWTVTAP
jgi:hypothetical protein